MTMFVFDTICLLLAFSFMVGQHLKDLKDPIMEGILFETENMLARGRMDLPLSLCFAALRGDDLLLHQLLKRGLDPSESDNNGRTALVGKSLLPLIFTFFNPTLNLNLSFFIFFCPLVNTAYSSI